MLCSQWMARSEVAHAGCAVLSVSDKENSISQDTRCWRASFWNICLCVVPVCVWEKMKGKQRMRRSKGLRTIDTLDNQTGSMGFVYSGLYSQRRNPPISLTTEACPWTNNTTWTISHKDFSMWQLLLRLSPSGTAPVLHYHSSGWFVWADPAIDLHLNLSLCVFFVFLRTMRPSSTPGRTTLCMHFWVWLLPQALRLSQLTQTHANSCRVFELRSYSSAIFPVKSAFVTKYIFVATVWFPYRKHILHNTSVHDILTLKLASSPFSSPAHWCLLSATAGSAGRCASYYRNRGVFLDSVAGGTGHYKNQYTPF